MITLINRLMIFFDLWGTYHYENKIDAAFAWELACILEEHSAALEGFERLELPAAPNLTRGATGDVISDKASIQEMRQK